jgi:hypothetical protein
LLLAWGYLSGLLWRLFFWRNGMPGVVAELFSGAFVELGGDVGDVDGWVDCQVGSLREILTDASVLVLVSASLPRAGAFGEEDPDTGRGGQVLVLGHLDALVPGESSFHLGWHRGEGSGDGGVHACGGVVMGAGLRSRRHCVVRSRNVTMADPVLPFLRPDVVTKSGARAR